MRTLLKFSMDVEATNHAIANGALEKTMDTLGGLIKPEAAYFTTSAGKRTGYMFFDLTDVSMIPQIAEPLFQTLNAEIELVPVMNREELARGLSSFHGGRKAA